jgi:hypothetical protein
MSVAGARRQPDVRVRLTVLHAVAAVSEPAVARIGDVDQNSAKVPQVLLRRPVELVVRHEVDDLEQRVLHPLPVR